ncbi:hypothetical protein H6P81_020253 [Aristolochia fimbriata]|uniref:Uncharacterized protein n=1 Tax=Aristolochia fimbriata TaxID=158543 RepID=A0AAV7DYG8_ARIFI|nr:hypothetical protein H6P81_020253 [Aristolochia fimbriata]
MSLGGWLGFSLWGLLAWVLLLGVGFSLANGAFAFLHLHNYLGNGGDAMGGLFWVAAVGHGLRLVTGLGNGAPVGLGTGGEPGQRHLAGLGCCTGAWALWTGLGWGSRDELRIGRPGQAWTLWTGLGWGSRDELRTGRPGQAWALWTGLGWGSRDELRIGPPGRAWVGIGRLDELGLLHFWRAWAFEAELGFVIWVDWAVSSIDHGLQLGFFAPSLP